MTAAPAGRPQVVGEHRPQNARTLTAVLWTLALVSLANLVYRSYFVERDDVDFRALYDGALRFTEGQSVYADSYFLLTPSGLLAVVPFGLLERDVAFAVWNTVSLGAAALGVYLSLRFAQVAVRGPLAAGAVLMLTLTPPLNHTIMFGNINNSLVLCLGAGFLLAERQDRRVLAGVLLGLSLALKPVMVLVLVIPLLRRQWSALAWAIGLPAVLNGVGLLVTPFREDFFEVTVPALLTAREDFNSSLWALGRYWEVPSIAVAVLRLAVIVLTLAVAWRLRKSRDVVLGLAVTYGALLTATFLSSSLSQAYYSVLLVPLLVTVGRASSPVAWPLAWIGVVLFAGLDGWRFSSYPDVTAAVSLVRPAAGWALLLGVLVYWALRAPRATPAPVVAAAEDDRAAFDEAPLPLRVGG